VEKVIRSQFCQDQRGLSWKVVEKWWSSKQKLENKIPKILWNRSDRIFKRQKLILF
jgi:hypothetical protein